MTGTMNLPVNATETAASYLWLDEDGVLVIINKPTVLHSESDAEENILATRNVSIGTPRPLLIDISQIKSMSREAREIYANEGRDNRIKAIALISASTTSRIIGNFFIGFNKPSVPTKLFTHTQSARKWLLTYI